MGVLEVRKMEKDYPSPDLAEEESCDVVLIDPEPEEMKLPIGWEDMLYEEGRDIRSKPFPSRVKREAEVSP